MNDKNLWEARYQAAERLHPTTPTAYLRDRIDDLPQTGLALDLAAGEGRNAVFLAEHGLDVIAVDVAERALQKGLQLANERNVTINAVVADLNHFSIAKAAFDLIVNFNYLQRSLATAIMDGLKPNGILIFETLTIEQRRWKPDFNPAYLLQSGELPHLFGALRVLDYREATLPSGQGFRSVASLTARKE